MKNFKMRCLTILVIVMSIFPVISFSTISVYANSRVSVEKQVVTFTSKDLLKATREAYREGKITKEQCRKVESIAFERLGRKGQNKIVRVGHLLHDHYFDNVTWSMMLALGAGSIGLVIGAIPGINASAASLISSVVGAGFSTYYGAERGVIIRVQSYLIHDEIIGPYYTSKYISIREQ